MAKKYGGTLSRRGPDILTEELAMILTSKTRFEFKPLFTVVHANLRARNLANGGEEMLRLRVYEKLQELVSKGMVDKVITKGVKEYFGLASLSAALPVVVPVAPVGDVVGTEEAVGLKEADLVGQGKRS